MATEARSTALGLAISSSFAMDDDASTTNASTTAQFSPDSSLTIAEKKYLEAANSHLKILDGVQSTNSRAKITFESSDEVSDEAGSDDETFETKEQKQIAMSFAEKRRLAIAAAESRLDEMEAMEKVALEERAVADSVDSNSKWEQKQGNAESLPQKQISTAVEAQTPSDEIR